MRDRGRNRVMGVLGFLGLAITLGGCEQALGLDRIETYSGSGTTTSGTGGTTSGTMVGGGGQSSTSSGGGGTTGSTQGGGGTGGGTTSSGTGGVGGAPLPTSCKEALAQGMTESGVVTILPPGAVAGDTLDVYCDQANMGGGWALVYSSVADPSMGKTTAFWNILYANRFDVIAPDGTTPSANYYAGALYKYGTEYRDDIEDYLLHVAVGVMHATVNGINPGVMRFMGGGPSADNMSDKIYKGQFAGGWSSPDHDADDEVDHNSSVYWGNVTQHYASDSLWSYNLGTDKDPNNPGQMPPDYTDGGWGPHVLDAAIDQINVALLAAGKGTLVKDGVPQSTASRVNRISRFARW